MGIILIGFMGAGKSTVARILDPSFIDMDSFIEARVGMQTAEYFDQFGESAFRIKEEEALKLLLTTHFRVLSTGGGLVESPANQMLLADRRDIVYLKASFETLVARIEADTDNRRALFEKASRQQFRALFDRRQEIYEKLSALIVVTEGKSPAEIAAEIKENLGVV